MNRLSSAALAAVLVLLPSVVAAQKSRDAPAALVHQAVENCSPVADAVALVKCALSRSVAVIQARGDVEAVRGRRLTAGQLLPANPAIEIGAGRRKTEAGLVDVDRGVDLSQQIEIGGQRGARLDVARAEEASAAVGLEAAEREIIIDVLEAVVAVERARAGVRFASEEREAAERLVEVSTGRAKQGVGPALDMELAEAARVQSRRGELSAAQALREAEARLALVVGADVKLVDGAAVPKGFVPDIGVAELERRALERRQTLQGPLAEARAARSRLDLLRRERVPDLTLAAVYKHEEFGDVFGGRLSIPLPIFRRNQGAIAEQEARIGQAEATAFQSELRVRLEVRAAYDAWERAIAVSNDIPTGLEDRLAADIEALRTAYARGAMPLPSALASLREAFAARRTLTDVRADAVVTSLELARATASPISPSANRGQP